MHDLVYVRFSVFVRCSLTLLVLCLAPLSAWAQFTLQSPTELQKVKQGNRYFALQPLSSHVSVYFIGDTQPVLQRSLACLLAKHANVTVTSIPEQCTLSLHFSEYHYMVPRVQVSVVQHHRTENLPEKRETLAMFDVALVDGEYYDAIAHRLHHALLPTLGKAACQHPVSIEIADNLQSCSSPTTATLRAALMTRLQHTRWARGPWLEQVNQLPWKPKNLDHAHASADWKIRGYYTALDVDRLDYHLELLHQGKVVKSYSKQDIKPSATTAIELAEEITTWIGQHSEPNASDDQQVEWKWDRNLVRDFYAQKSLWALEHGLAIEAATALEQAIALGADSPTLQERRVRAYCLVSNPMWRSLYLMRPTGLRTIEGVNYTRSGSNMTEYVSNALTLENHEDPILSAQYATGLLVNLLDQPTRDGVKVPYDQQALAMSGQLGLIMLNHLQFIEEKKLKVPGKHKLISSLDALFQHGVKVMDSSMASRMFENTFAKALPYLYHDPDTLFHAYAQLLEGSYAYDQVPYHSDLREALRDASEHWPKNWDATLKRYLAPDCAFHACAAAYVLRGDHAGDFLWERRSEWLPNAERTDIPYAVMLLFKEHKLDASRYFNELKNHQRIPSGLGDLIVDFGDYTEAEAQEVHDWLVKTVHGRDERELIISRLLDSLLYTHKKVKGPYREKGIKREKDWKEHTKTVRPDYDATAANSKAIVPIFWLYEDINALGKERYDGDLKAFSHYTGNLKTDHDSVYFLDDTHLTKITPTHDWETWGFKVFPRKERLSVYSNSWSVVNDIVQFGHEMWELEQGNFHDILLPPQVGGASQRRGGRIVDVPSLSKKGMINHVHLMSGYNSGISAGSTAWRIVGGTVMEVDGQHGTVQDIYNTRYFPGRSSFEGGPAYWPQGFVRDSSGAQFLDIQHGNEKRWLYFQQAKEDGPWTEAFDPKPLTFTGSSLLQVGDRLYHHSPSQSMATGGHELALLDPSNPKKAKLIYRSRPDLTNEEWVFPDQSPVWKGLGCPMPDFTYVKGHAVFLSRGHIGTMDKKGEVQWRKIKLHYTTTQKQLIEQKKPADYPLIFNGIERIDSGIILIPRGIFSPTGFAYISNEQLGIE